MDLFVGAWKDAVLKNYANFSGRLGVGGFWRFFGINILIAIVLAILAQMLSILWILYIGYVLALLIPGLAAEVRRLHDTGKSGWLVLVGLIPIVGVILLIIWFIKPGDAADNAYGPAPGGMAAAAA